MKMIKLIMDFKINHRIVHILGRAICSYELNLIHQNINGRDLMRSIKMKVIQ